MDIETMVNLIRQEWSDAMSDNGAIWKRSYDALQLAKTAYPDLYDEALAMAYEARINNL